MSGTPLDPPRLPTAPVEMEHRDPALLAAPELAITFPEEQVADPEALPSGVWHPPAALAALKPQRVLDLSAQHRIVTTVLIAVAAIVMTVVAAMLIVALQSLGGSSEPAAAPAPTLAPIVPENPNPTPVATPDGPVEVEAQVTDVAVTASGCIPSLSFTVPPARPVVTSPTEFDGACDLKAGQTITVVVDPANVSDVRPVRGLEVPAAVGPALLGVAATVLVAAGGVLLISRLRRRAKAKKEAARAARRARWAIQTRA